MNKISEHTIKINNYEYNQYYKLYSDSNKRDRKVAWVANGSQKDNFDLVSKHIDKDNSVLDYGCGLGDFSQVIPNTDYLGVDINENYINEAKESYKKRFELIHNIDELTEKFDTVCAIGVFTWYITKDEFIATINKLCEVANKQVLLTFVDGHTPYEEEVMYSEEEDVFWNRKYREYSKNLFIKLFPKLNLTFEVKHNDRYNNVHCATLLVKIEK